MKYTQLILITAMTLLSGSLGWAQDHKTEASKNENVIQKITDQEKRIRKKKVEMCSECGKPESECECHGHDKEELSKGK